MEEAYPEPVMLSALQHYSYCPRQCALIHQEQIFDDNVFTLRGQRAHRRVDSGEETCEDGHRVVRALPLFSDRLGLIGKADVVEFLGDSTPYPVEYKQGRRQKREHDDIQLAAQALCLEEMTGKHVPEGAIYHHKTRRRRTVPITDTLRQRVIDTAQAIRHMLASDHLPPPTEDPALCRACSLRDACQPEIATLHKRLRRQRKKLFDVEDDKS